MMEVEIGPLSLPGNLQLTNSDAGLVLFAHGSGSSRFSPRNKQVANALNQAGLGTLLFDLLLPNESNNASFVFNIPLLAGRLYQATEWANHWLQKKGMENCSVGFFGASTGAAASLWAAADLKGSIAAIVARGGRVDLASTRLKDVSAPTLLIVGNRDEAVLELNRQALRLLPFAELFTVANASHLFEEEGALEDVASRAGAWFLNHFKPALRKAA